MRFRTVMHLFCVVFSISFKGKQQCQTGFGHCHNLAYSQAAECRCSIDIVGELLVVGFRLFRLGVMMTQPQAVISIASLSLSES